MFSPKFLDLVLCAYWSTFYFYVQVKPVKKKKEKKNAVEAYVYDMRNKVELILTYKAIDFCVFLVSRSMKIYQF